MTWSPAVTVEAILSGLQACGIDAATLRKELGLAPRYADPSELLPYSVWGRIWTLAAAVDPRPELPTLAALQVPFGVFGTLDYLAGSSHTVRGSLQALADHFSAVSSVRELEIDLPERDVGTLRVINSAAGDAETDEFVTAVLLGRFRTVTGGKFQAQRVYLTRASLAESPHRALLEAPMVYGAARAGFDIPVQMLDLKQHSADSRLHNTLLEISKKLGYRTDKAGGFEISVRSRLRSLLPRGQAVAERVARSLGVSERTLQRRLSDLGTSFQEVLDQFRVEESERLLLQRKLELSEIALAMGFSDQAAWSRAFRRVRGASPAAWLAAHTGSADRGR
jgi:AraC-like DNA-binding protein